MRFNDMVKKQRLKKRTHDFGDGITFTPGYDDEPQYWPRDDKEDYHGLKFEEYAELVEFLCNASYIGDIFLKVSGKEHYIRYSENRRCYDIYLYRSHLDEDYLGTIPYTEDVGEFMESFYNMPDPSSMDAERNHLRASFDEIKRIAGSFGVPENKVVAHEDELYVEVCLQRGGWLKYNERSIVRVEVLEIAQALSQTFENCTPYYYAEIHPHYDNDGHSDDFEQYYSGVYISFSGQKMVERTYGRDSFGDGTWNML